MTKLFRVMLVFLAVAVSSKAMPQAHAGLILLGDDDLHKSLGAGFGSIGWLQTVDPVNGAQFGGSGVLIDRHWVLMAGHESLRVNSDSSSFYSSYSFGFGTNYFSNPGESLIASELYLHPNYGGVGSNDLALLYFATPFTITAPANLHGADVVIGNEGNTVGFGNLQYINDPNFTFTGDRRAGFDVVESATGTTFSTRMNSGFSPNYRVGEMGGRPGDSGAPYLINGEVAGILYGGSLSNGLGTNTFFTDLSTYSPWIESTKAIHSAVPEPSSIFLLALASIGSYAFGRRRLKSF